MHVVHSRLLQCCSLSQHKSTLFCLFNILSRRSRRTREEVAAKRSAIRGGDTDFRMHVIHSKLLESRSLFQNLGTLISKLIILGLSSRGTAKVVAAKASTIGRGDSNFGMHVVHSRLLQCCSLSQHKSTLFCLFNILSRRSRRTREEVAAKRSAIRGGDTDFRMHVIHSKLLESRSLFQNLGTLISKLIILGLSSRRATKVVAAKASTISGGNSTLGVCIRYGERLEGACVSEDTAAFRQSFVELSVFLVILQ